MIFPELDNNTLRRRRNAYGYPAVCLTGDLKLLEEVEFASTRELDEHLNRLLRSDLDDEVIAGYLGVIFWGFASGADGKDRRPRAHARVRLAQNGMDRVVLGKSQRIRGIADLGVQYVAGNIRGAIRKLDNEEYSEALKDLIQLPQAKMAFASKVCAFISPDKCGVIDTVIVNNYPQLGFSQKKTKTGKKGDVKDTVANIGMYREYCTWLQETAELLNQDADNRQWTDRDGAKRSWRALDVERSLYN